MPNYFDAEKKIKRIVPCDDNLNFARTVVLAKLIADAAYAHKHGNENEEIRARMDIKNIRRSKRSWNTKAEQFLLQANLDRDQEAVGYDAFRAAAATLRNYKIAVYTRTPPAKVYTLIWKGNENSEKTMNIGLFSEVYDIFKPTRDSLGFKWCGLCSQTYTRLDLHFCESMCKQCRKPNCQGQQIQPTECNDCHVIFYKQECFDSHKVLNRTSSICSMFKRCPLPDCLVFYKPRNLPNGIHVCGETEWCSDCSRHVRAGLHNCSWTPPTALQKQKLLEKQEKFKILIYDLETVLLEESDNLENHCEQWPNYVGYSMFCEQCIGTPIDTACNNCGPNRTGHFKYTTRDEPRDAVIKKFVHFLLYDRTLDNTIVIAHNGSRFDLHFLIKPMIDVGIKPDLLKKGLKIIQMCVKSGYDANHNNLKFKDSFLFVPVALSAMPKAFGFPDMKKGTFPYLYNHPAHYGSVSATLPPLEYYNPNEMKKGAHSEFMEWYEENRNTVFDFDKELHEYCMNDIAVLHQGVSRYIKSSIELTTFNPVVHACTFASFSFFILKNVHMEPNQVGIIPEHGFHSNDVQSKLAIKYFKWIENVENIDLQYALKGGEKVVHIGGRRVKFDAYHEETNTVIEVLGCWIHGCDIHTKPDTKHPYYDKTMGDLLRETKERLALITAAGYNLRVIWEHDIDTELASNTEMRKFFKYNQHYKRLRVRDSFSGGRTQNYRMYAKSDPDQNITLQHRDVVSMYPFLLCNNPMPLGQPEVLTTNIAPITLPLPYNGFYLIDILPPRDLLHPVIPYKHNDRLLFGLCRECMLAEQDTDCPHEDEDDRYLHVTVYQAELELALRLGYKVLRVYEVYHWGPNRWSTKMFRDFLLKFIKVKTEASGWPREDMTQQEKDQFVEDFYQHEGIRVDPAKMVKNSEARAIAKIIISSVWGKMAETDDKITVSFHDPDSQSLSEVLNNDTTIVIDMEIVGNVYMVSTKKVENFQKARPYTNVAYASIVCSLGRVELYKMLERLGSLACYGDTDSGVYMIENGNDKLSDMAGSYLGKWSSEVPEGYEIVEFVSTGPKVYSYRLRNVETGEIKEIVKTRGITISVANSEVINFDSIRKLAEDLMVGINTEIVTEKSEIVKKFGHVYTENRTKKLRAVMKKLRFFPDSTTKPFGWKE